LHGQVREVRTKIDVPLAGDIRVQGPERMGRLEVYSFNISMYHGTK
jgi:hypothetical protein